MPKPARSGLNRRMWGVGCCAIQVENRSVLLLFPDCRAEGEANSRFAAKLARVEPEARHSDGPLILLD